jgi:hypothetical protein
MTEPMIEQTESEVPEFSDELSDEALDQVGERFSGGCSSARCAA